MTAMTSPNHLLTRWASSGGAAEADPAIDSVEFHVRAIDEQANRAAEPKPSVAPGPTVNQPEEAEDSMPKSRRGAV